jgi:glutathione S-transferase
MATRQLLFSPNSPYARKVRIVLAEKALEFQPQIVDTAKLPEGFPRTNPNLRIPVLVDGERTVFESNLILDYLLRTYPATPPGASAPPLAATMTRPERHWDDSLITITIETMLDTGLNLFQLTRDGVQVEPVPYLRKELSRTQACLDWLEARATPEGFVPGQFSIQDLNLVCALQWADFRKPFPWRGRAKLERIVAKYAERPSVKATLPG